MRSPRLFQCEKQIIDVNDIALKVLAEHTDILIVDIREVEEYQEQHIPNAFHIPKGELLAGYAFTDMQKTQPVLYHCRSGRRSAEAAVSIYFREAGFEGPIYHMTGGILQWINCGLPVEQAKNALELK